MQLIRDASPLPAELCGGAVAIGNFDGVHKGHARIVERLLARAREVKGPAVVLTFDPHPVRLLRPAEAPPPLTWLERKAELLAELGVDSLVAYPTDQSLLELTPQAFFQQIICDWLEARTLVEGPNFFFGHNRAGDIRVLDELCRAHGKELEIVQPLEVGGQFISSSRVRKLVAAGEVAEAAQLLTQPYRIRGLVTHGAKRGAGIGFPTANVEAIDTLLPREGVYAGRAFPGGQENGGWAAAINIGPNPTFGEKRLKVEVHLIDFDRSLYGEPLEVDFLARLRDIQPFASVKELQAQLTRDVAAAARAAD